MSLISLHEKEIDIVLELIDAEIALANGRLMELKDRFESGDGFFGVEDIKSIEEWTVHRSTLEQIKHQIEWETKRCKG